MGSTDAGADHIVRMPGTIHLLGTCRMGSDPEKSLVDPWRRSHDFRNLFICDGSVFVTGGTVNPSLTIQALAARTAGHILQYGRQRISREKARPREKAAAAR